jgi:hypothetical protein
MAQKKEEWQSMDSGYLNCIGVGDTYVRKQMERILSSEKFDANIYTKKAITAEQNVYALGLK